MRQILLAIRRRLIATTASFALLFSILAATQYFFVRHQLLSDAWADAYDSAVEIANQIVGTNGLDLEAVRNAFFPIREWYILGMDGTVVDLEGLQPSLLGPVKSPSGMVFGTPATIASAFGESWRVLGKRVEGGTVIVGVAEPSGLADPDMKLETNLVRFGATISSATQLNPKKLDGIIDYAVVDQGGKILSAAGGIPLRGALETWPNALKSREFVLDGKPYLLAQKVVSDTRHRPLVMVLVTRNITAEHIALHSQKRFNIAVSIIAWSAAVAIILVNLVRDEIRRLRVQPSLTEARKLGEGQHVEFKRSLLWDRERSFEDEKLRSKILKTIVAFLNSGGGALFIGVQDDGQPWGISDDLKRCDGSEDKFHQRLRNFIVNSIGGEFSQYVMSRIIDDPDFAGHRVCFVGVDGSCRAAFLKAGSHGYFYVRSGPESIELDMERAYRYIREAKLKI